MGIIVGKIIGTVIIGNFGQKYVNMMRAFNVGDAACPGKS